MNDKPVTKETEQRYKAYVHSMANQLKQDGYTVEQVQRMAWNLRKYEFPESARWLNEVADRMKL